ncbi:hypothetical protein HYALB_00002416 [Hymenoscyphus albidus]|uniref:Uncharacterized protein n=1 Tax=Hymenoscyphus albidus TaxID=595503 RepID=A0A9N9LN63_9HELO|nr:hypothetical protein HYALB_00002416 [Hymenoscyphus albidus]
MASLSKLSTTIASLVIAALPNFAQSSTTHNNQHHNQITNAQTWYTEQRKMCLVESFNFKKCPCKLTRRHICYPHLQSQRMTKYKANKPLFLPIHTYSLVQEREDKPDVVIDLEGCLKFHEQPIEEGNGYCGMVESGCPERVLSDELLEWKGRERLCHSGNVLGEGGIAEEPESYGDEGVVGEWKEEEDGVWLVEECEGDGLNRRNPVGRSSLHGETQRKRKISLHIETGEGGIPQGTQSSSMDKPLPPPPVVAVSPEAVHMDPRHALAMIPDEEDGELTRPRSESLEETDPRIVFYRSMGFTNN